VVAMEVSDDPLGRCEGCEVGSDCRLNLGGAARTLPRGGHEWSDLRKGGLALGLREGASKPSGRRLLGGELLCSPKLRPPGPSPDRPDPDPARPRLSRPSRGKGDSVGPA